MKNTLLLLCIPLFFIGCKKDEISITDTFEHCIERSEQAVVADSCINSLPNFFCEIKDIGADSLDDESRSYLPQYCLFVKDTLRYENNTGELTTYIVTDKLNIRTTNLLNSFVECPEDSSKTIANCFFVDLVELRLESINENISFNIKVSNIVDDSSEDLALSGDRLSICRGAASGNACREELHAIINQKNLTYSQTQTEERIDKIELNGSQYNDVISNINTNPFLNGFTYYYNRQMGLIGYLDEEGELWTIKE